MIDIEGIVFNTVATALRSEFSGIFVAGEAVAAPSSFPAVTLVEEDNSIYQRSMDSSHTENHAQVMYAVNVYSNLSSGKKTQCKAIVAAIDNEMLGMGFVRTSNTPAAVPNADSSICRMVARYRAVTDGTLIYRR